MSNIPKESDFCSRCDGTGNDDYLDVGIGQVTILTLFGHFSACHLYVGTEVTFVNERCFYFLLAGVCKIPSANL